MLTLKANCYSEQEKEEVQAIFTYLSESVCNYCADKNQHFLCFHSCPYHHVIQDLQNVTKIYKK